MDVRCDKCKTEYEFDDDRITDAGVTVKCTTCGHVFKVKKKAIVVTLPVGAHDDAAAGPSPSQPIPKTPEPAPEKPKEWKVRQANGNVFTFKELTTLQKWIVERKVARDDEITLTGENWKRLGNISELASFFQVVEDAQRANQLAALQTLTSLNLSGPVLPPSGGVPIPLVATAHAAPSYVPPVAPAVAAPPASNPAAPEGARGPGRTSTSPLFQVPPTGKPASASPATPARRSGALGWVVSILLLGALGAAGYFGYLEYRRLLQAGQVQPIAVLIGSLKTRLTALTDRVIQSVASNPRPEAVVAIADAGAVPDAGVAPDAGPTIQALAPAVDAGSDGGTLVTTILPTAAPEPVAVPDAGMAAADEVVQTPPKVLTSKLRAKAEPRDFDSYMRLGDRMREREKPEAAIDAYAKAAQLKPYRAEPLAGRGWALLDMGAKLEAEAAFKDALVINPRYGVALMGMAETYKALGKKGDAVRYYEKYLEVQPNGQDAYVARSALKNLQE